MNVRQITVGGRQFNVRITHYWPGFVGSLYEEPEEPVVDFEIDDAELQASLTPLQWFKLNERIAKICHEEYVI